MNWICVGFGPPGYIAAVEMRGEGRVKLGEGGGVQTRAWCYFGIEKLTNCPVARNLEREKKKKRCGGRRKDGKEM